MESQQKTMKITVLRYRPEQDKAPWEQTFDVPYHKDTSVLEALFYIKDNFDGYEMHLFRYPAGIFTEQSLAIVNNCGYRSVFWSFAYMDYDVNNQPDPTEALNKVVSKLHPGAIYLLHAESETNTKILGQFIDEARAQGYRFEMLQ